MTTDKNFIVAIELGSSKVTGIAGQKRPDGSISILSVLTEDSSSFIRKGVVYNIDKTAQCLQNMIQKMEGQLKTHITQVFVGVGGQSIRSVRNSIVKELPEETIITQQMVAELMDSNWALDYPDQKILDVAEQEYRVDAQLQMDPVGIRANRLEGNFLNILERKSFFLNLNKCFEVAGIQVADMYLAPLALANSVLTEAEKRSGCALVDIGADTTTVTIFSKNVLRHLAVIPLGSANVTKDIATLQMEESDAEKMKLKHASAYTESNEIDPALKYAIDTDRQVESQKFIEIVEGRMTEIIENVRYQIPSEYDGKLLGGIILTGGGANMKNIEKAFKQQTGIDKVRTAKFVTMTINSSNDLITTHNGMMNTVLGLLAKGDINCAGRPLNQTADLFGNQNDNTEVTPSRGPRQLREKPDGSIRSIQEEELAAEKARLQKEEEERLNEQRRQEALEEERRQQEEERRRRKENSFWSKIKRKFEGFSNELASEE